MPIVDFDLRLKKAQHGIHACIRRSMPPGSILRLKKAQHKHACIRVRLKKAQHSMHAHACILRDACCGEVLLHMGAHAPGMRGAGPDPEGVHAGLPILRPYGRLVHIYIYMHGH